MFRLAPILALLALLHLAGGHWALWQGVAWTKMFFSAVQKYSLTESLQKTFSPDAKCSLCLKVDKGRQEERKQSPMLFSTTKIEAALPTRNNLLTAPPSRDFSYSVPADSRLLSWVSDIPVPVPIALS